MGCIPHSAACQDPHQDQQWLEKFQNQISYGKINDLKPLITGQTEIATSLRLLNTFPAYFQLSYCLQMCYPSCYFARFTAQRNTYNSIYNSQLFKPKFGWLQKSIFITIKMSLTKEKSEKDLIVKHSSNPPHFIAVFSFTATAAGGCTRPTTVHQI